MGQRREQADGEAGEQERDLKEGEERAVYSFSKLLSLLPKLVSRNGFRERKKSTEPFL
jgi:hypothetical protein